MPVSPAVMLVLLEKPPRNRRERASLEEVPEGAGRLKRQRGIFVPSYGGAEMGGFASVTVEEHLEGLPAEVRVLVEDRIEGYTYREIAKRRGVSQRKIAAAVRQMKERLS